jgi:hypothetical protein
MNRTQTRMESWAPWLAGALLAAPVLLAYYPPMTDLAFHEGVIGLLRNAGDASKVPPGLYVRNLGEPNQLFHMAGWGLAYMMSTRWAVKLLVAAAVLSLPVAAGRLARHVGASPLAALVVAPMALGWLFAWGLITNLIGLSVLLATLPVYDRLAARPTWRHTTGALGATVLLYFAHETMMIVAAGVSLGLALLHPWSWRASLSRLSPFVGALTMVWGQARWQLRFMSPTVAATPTVFRPLKVKLLEMAYIVLPATDQVVQFAMVALCALAIGTFFWLRGRERAEARETTIVEGSRFVRARGWALRYRWELVAATGVAAYLAFPVSLNGARLVHERWLPPAFAILAIVAAPRNLWVRRARVAVLAVMVLPIGTLLSAAPPFFDSDAQYRGFQMLVDRVAPGSAVASIFLGPADPVRGYSLGPAPGRILAERGGRLAYAFTDSSVSPMFLARRYQWNESLVRITYESWSFMPQHDFTRFRYLILRAREARLKWLASYALAREATLIGEFGEWALFESKLNVVPLTSPDVPLPNPRPETLRDRVLKVSQELSNSSNAAPAEIPAEPPSEASPNPPPPP